MARVEGVLILKLHDQSDSQMKPLIPELFEARVVAIGNTRMLFQGLTARWEDGGVAQEWAIEIVP